MPKDIEIEIQVKIEKLKPLLAFLKKNGQLLGTFRQKDEYFTPPHRNFLAKKPTNEWLRLRDSGNRSFINYKNWYRDTDGKSEHCDEYETKIEDIGQMRKLFSVLNMQSIALVDKKRQIWRYKNYEVAIDSVANLGNFVEVEYKGKSTTLTPKQITKQMTDFLKEVGCGEILRNFQGYPFLILFPKEAKWEKQ